MQGKVSIILDTDMDTDCDDVGALSVLHALADCGEAEILGVICNVPVPWCAPCVKAINTYYGRAHIPIGEIKVNDYGTEEKYRLYREHREKVALERRYNRFVAEKYLKRNENSDHFPDAIKTYRRILSQQPDNSVVICGIGLLSVLAALLSSPPDSESQLNGVDLIKQKVNLLVTMGEAPFPEGADPFNWKMDGDAAGQVLTYWPTKIAVSSCGKNVLTGARLTDETSYGNPTREAYEIFLGQPRMNRPSWDQIAVLYAVKGTASLFNEKTGYSIHYNRETGFHRWEEEKHNASGSHVLISPVISNDELAKIIEDLMVHEPIAVTKMTSSSAKARDKNNS